MPRLQALRRNLALLLNRPTPPPLAPRDQLDPLTASAHTISRMSALYLCSRINCCAVRLHGQHASYHHPATQCGFNTPLTAESLIHEYYHQRIWLWWLIEAPAHLPPREVMMTSPVSGQQRPVCVMMHALLIYASLIDFYSWAEWACPDEGAWRGLGSLPLVRRGRGRAEEYAPGGVAATARESSVRGRCGRMSVRACLSRIPCTAPSTSI